MFENNRTKKDSGINTIEARTLPGKKGQTKETSQHCVFAITGAKFSGYYQFKKGFYGLADIPTLCQDKIDRTIGYCTPDG